MPPVNLAVLCGTLSKPAEARLLADGSTVWELDVMIRKEGLASSSVPVSWAATQGAPTRPAGPRAMSCSWWGWSAAGSTVPAAPRSAGLMCWRTP